MRNGCQQLLSRSALNWFQEGSVYGLESQNRTARGMD